MKAILKSTEYSSQLTNLLKVSYLKKNTFDLLTPEARQSISAGIIPDLLSACDEIYGTFSKKDCPYHAMQFIPALKNVILNDSDEIKIFLRNPVTKHILIQNELIKMVLIHWIPGEKSSIHGHPAGGCVFKVLKGELEEKRFNPDYKKKLLARSRYKKGAMAYIDDHMALHEVGNPFKESAISLHIYTPGIKSINSLQ